MCYWKNNLTNWLLEDLQERNFYREKQSLKNPEYSLLQMKYILFAVENTNWYWQLLLINTTEIRNNPPEKADAAKTGKRGSVTCKNNNIVQGEKFSPSLPTRWVKKRYPLLFRKYEIHKGWHLYRTHKKAGYTRVYPTEKKIQIFY